MTSTVELSVTATQSGLGNDHLTTTPVDELPKCFQIVEILIRILWVVRAQDDNLVSVAAMAAVCRALYEPAMDVLWHTLPDMTPAVRCLAASRWYVVEEEIYYRFKSVRLYTPWTLSDQDWERTLRNARRVRKIHLPRVIKPFNTPERSELWTLSYEALQAMHNLSLRREAQADLPQGFFPNLHSMEWPWDMQVEASIAFMPLLVGNSLTVFTMNPKREPKTQQSRDSVVIALAHLVARCPRLKKVHFGQQMGREWENSGMEITRTFLNLPRLCSLRDNVMVSIETFHALGYIPTLEELVVTLEHIPPDELARYLAVLPHQSVVQYLKSLTVRFLNMSGSHALFDAIASEQLESLTVLYPFPLSPCSAIHKFANSLRRFRTLKTLLLNTQISYDTGGELGDPVLASRVLRPLFDIQSLKEVHILPHIAVDVDDEFMVNLARAWPAIEILEIMPQVDFVVRPAGSVSLRCLTGFVQHCPRLRSLDLPMNPTFVRDGDPAPEKFHQWIQPFYERRHGLANLSVGFLSHAPENEITQAAAFLNKLFPNLLKFQTCLHMPYPDPHAQASRRTLDMTMARLLGPRTRTERGIGRQVWR